MSDPPIDSFFDYVGSDGAGGLVVLVRQLYAGETTLRTTVWAMDAAGARKRLGCSPPADYAAVPVAIAPDAVYFLVRNGMSQMQIARVPR